MSALKRAVAASGRFANPALKTSYLDDLEPKVCGLIVLVENAARSPRSWVQRCQVLTRLGQFTKQDMIDVARLPRSAALFWHCAQCLVQSVDPDERQHAAATILNLHEVRWRRSQRPRQREKRRTDFA